ncbi:uncharacterized protein LOC112459441 [Temnothorax curvispinosus]|uniref:Uncharacterized protein LOC112459441 n=1 Tax=Temnothorax curvispinosus TaxID=300111 RepID=A0A6J1QF24_9HYME|nr:uncharacterized protein LOC112459441 [Temnothorax curvispinosus]
MYKIISHVFFPRSNTTPLDKKRESCNINRCESKNTDLRVIVKYVLTTLILIYSLVLQVVALRNEALTAIEIMQPVTTVAIATRLLGLQGEHAGFAHFKLVRHRARKTVKSFARLSLTSKKQKGSQQIRIRFPFRRARLKTAGEPVTRELSLTER